MPPEQGPMEFEILAARPDHLDAIVRCDQDAFPGEFMTLIGARFIRGFYRFYISRNGGIVLVAVDASGRVVGLVTGGRPELRKQFCLRCVPLYVFDIAFSALTNKYVMRRLLQHIFSVIKSVLVSLRLMPGTAITGKVTADLPETWSSLLSICTDPDSRGSGIGKLLLEAFEVESRARGYKTMRLSVHSDNDAAIELYKKCGWEIILETPKGIYFEKEIKT